jgi:hypothetical protein
MRRFLDSQQNLDDRKLYSFLSCVPFPFMDRLRLARTIAGSASGNDPIRIIRSAHASRDNVIDL